MANLPTIQRNSTYRFTWTHKHNGELASLEGCTVACTVKDIEGDDVLDDSSALMQKIVTEHLPQAGGTLGKTVIEFTPTETRQKLGQGEVIQKGNYYFDIMVKHADGSQFKEEEGRVRLDSSPTNRVL